MKQVIKFGRLFIKGAAKTVAAITIGLFFLIAAILVILNIPSVQESIITYISTEASTLLKHKVSIKDFSLSWVDEVILEEVDITDQKGGAMIHVEQIRVNFNLTSIAYGPFMLDEATLANGQVNMILYASDSTVNFNSFIACIQDLAPPRKARTSLPPPFVISKVRLENMFFSYNDQRYQPVPDQFDHYHFAFDHIDVEAENFRLRADTLQFSLFHLGSEEVNTGLQIHTLRTEFLLNKSKIEFNRLYAHIGNSEIKDYFCMSYKTMADISTDFNALVELKATLNKSKVDVSDVAWFAPDLRGIQEKVVLSGNMKGTIDHFIVNKFDLAFGKSSHLAGRLTFVGLPDIDNTFTEMRFKKMNVLNEDIKPYLDPITWPYLDKFAYLRGDGSFTGTFNDFVTKGEFHSALGDCKTNLALTFPEDNSLPRYKGYLQTTEFNLGTLFNISSVSTIDMDGDIEGYGLTPQDANLTVNASIQKIVINHYPYRNITTNATISEQYFDGELDIKDSNLVMHSNGLVDLKNGKDTFAISGHIEKINFQKTGLASINLIGKSDFDLNFKSTNLDSITGNLNFKNTYLIYADNKELYIDSLYASVKNTGTRDQRYFIVRSDLVDISVNGDYTLRSLYGFMNETYQEYKMGIYNDKATIDEYYANKKTNTATHHATFFCDAKDLNAIFDIFIPGLYVTKGTTVEGDFTSGYTNIIRGYSHIGEVYYKGFEFLDSDIELDLSKVYNSSDILAMVYLKSATQKFNSLETTDLKVEALWSKDTIQFNTYIKQKDAYNEIKLDGYLAINEDYNIIKLHNSNVNVNKRRWNIDDQGLVKMQGNNFEFSAFTLQSGNQSIYINGSISEDPEEKLLIYVRNYDLSKISSLFKTPPMKGILNGQLQARNLYNQIRLDGDAHIDSLEFNGIHLGTLDGTAKWNQGSQYVALDMEIVSPRNELIDVRGKIFKNQETNVNEINMDAILKQANMVILNPIFEGILSDIKGQMTGNFSVTGPLTSPDIKGKVIAENASMHVPYLGTTYSVHSPFLFEEGHIQFHDMKLEDSYGNHAQLYGDVYHEGFKNFILDIKGNMRNFMIMNTGEEDNDMFYGKAIVTGKAAIFGPTDSITINANATSERGTHIAIPITSGKTVTKQDYIRFNNRSKGGGLASDDSVALDLSGITMNFNFDITEDAYTEIIFDKRAGDIIRGWGKGVIKMNIDTRGDFNMYGTYAIQKGYYNYTLAGLINKEFQLDKNSTISWNGNPYEGILDIRARYNQYTSLKPLFDSTTIANTPDLSKKYPVDVKLNVKGNLMSPEIGLDIDILRYPTTAQVTTGVTEFKNRIHNDENELNKQVFSLLILRSFAAYNSFQGVSSGGGNLSELLSNQLSNFLSQVDDNLQIDINLGSMDKEALNTFQMRFSYSLMNDRLRISRDGGFYNSNSKTNNNSNNVSNLAGEWTIEYLLSADGKLRLKLYNRINQNSNLINVNYNTTTTAGFSITHTQSFSSLNDLFMGKKERFRRDEAETFIQQLYMVKPAEEQENGEDQNQEEHDHGNQDEDEEDQNNPPTIPVTPAPNKDEEDTTDAQ